MWWYNISLGQVTSSKYWLSPQLVNPGRAGLKDIYCLHCVFFCLYCISLYLSFSLFDSFLHSPGFFLPPSVGSICYCFLLIDVPHFSLPHLYPLCLHLCLRLKEGISPCDSPANCKILSSSSLSYSSSCIKANQLFTMFPVASLHEDNLAEFLIVGRLLYIENGAFHWRPITRSKWQILAYNPQLERNSSSPKAMGLAESECFREKHLKCRHLNRGDLWEQWSNHKGCLPWGTKNNMVAHPKYYRGIFPPFVSPSPLLCLFNKPPI